MVNNSLKAVVAVILAIGVGAWIKIVKTGPVCDSDTDLTGKTVLITGGNVGVGKETAIGLAKHNAKVIIACRNSSKAEKAVTEIRLESGNDLVTFMELDLAEMADVRKFANEYIAKEERLDILVNNAGTITDGKTKDNFDMMFGINHLGPFLLTNLLLPLLRKTSKKNPVRIINVSSKIYAAGKIDFNNLNPDVDSNSGMKEIFLEYANTKLMNIYFTSELDKRLKKENVAITTYSLHPGTVNTNFALDLTENRGTLFVYVREVFVWLASMSSFYGAQTSLHCCLEKGIEDQSGRFFHRSRPIDLLSIATDPAIGPKLWEVSEVLTGLTG
uniref:dehydrogenase/reductase SDR family member 13-like n=1 Tax=Styela clava TaxID=7725 RepID=UPI001939A9F6|nr:dehydrogenase/reductase SDR family member 13-like [Styela clava]